MSAGLYGTVVIDRQTADDDLWLCEPFSRGQAWLDLTLLANDRPRSLKVRGVDVALEVGEVGRSVVALADRWQWSREKVRRFLEELRDARKITYRMDNVATVIRVLDYSVHNRPVEDSGPGADPTAKPTAVPAADPTAKPTQNSGTGEKEKENLGTGERARAGEASFPPTEADVRAWALVAGVDPDFAAKKWAVVDEAHGWRPNGQRLEWQRRFARYWEEDRKGWEAGQKTAADRPGVQTFGGRSPAQVRYQLDRQLQEVQQRLNDAFELDTPPDPVDRQLEKDLKKQLAALDAPLVTA